MSITAPAPRRTTAKTPRFTPGQFTDSGYKDGTAAAKARFANALVKFIAEGFPAPKFKRALYLGLTLHFEHIAHYDLPGFYFAQFETPATQAAFLNHLIITCDRSWSKRPDLWQDVQAALVEGQNREWLASQLADI